MTGTYIKVTPSKPRGNLRYYGLNRVVRILRSKAPHILFLIACWFLGEWIWIEAKAWLAEGLIASAWNETRSGTNSVRPWPWADTWPVAVLQVPRLDVERFVLAGVSGRVLAFGPGWAEQTNRPGMSGPSLIAGHRDTHFRFLKELQQGDRLVIRTPEDGQVAYRVTEMAILDRQQRWLMSKEGVQALILVTCYPFNALLPGGDLRYVVRAEAEDGIEDDTDLPVW
ncbi:MAG: class GN sortase [Candidatus Thiodiazotropha sp. (ex Codakia rugifera)]|nr:class GN sortase [Candidatus Thiodiazotropha sp. (ex Codakia rugifera)]